MVGADVCPSNHPYSFDQGTKCCAFYQAYGSIKGLTFEDPEEMCLHSDWIECPDLVRKCVSLATKPAGNGLIMNASKTQLMHGGKVRRADLEDFHVVVDGVTVFPDKKLELLGVKFDSSFSTFPHGASVAASARQRATMIARLPTSCPGGTKNFEVRLSNTTGSNDWRLSLNSSLASGANLDCGVPLYFHVLVDGVTVFPDKKLELLGVKFDSSFRTFPHGASVSASARQRAAMIARLSHHLPRGAYLQQLARGLVLGKRAGLSSLNELTVHAVAKETWRAFHSQDGPDGSRNALGQVLFPSNVATRSTRSEAAGVVSPHLPFAAHTLVDNGIAMWNKFLALRETSTKRMASNMANRRFSLQGSQNTPRASPTTRRANNLGIGYAKRHQERRASAMTLETVTCEDGKHMMLKGEDGQMHKVEIISTREHVSIFTQNCPVLPMVLAVICAILNLIPGIGTFVAALCNLCCHSHQEYKAPKTFGIQLLTCFLQILSAPLILGFFWSWWYGILMVQKSRSSDPAAEVE
eukprot:maker-scaffold58_size443543-snap-gene-0.7 protein:Tk00686 transcript:maker-scaffold58_size443543-snap-gene-0.7-mRNA-1 annotation:"protein spec3"